MNSAINDFRIRCQNLTNSLNQNTVKEIEAECEEAMKIVNSVWTEDERVQVRDMLLDLYSAIIKEKLATPTELRLIYQSEISERKTGYPLAMILERANRGDVGKNSIISPKQSRLQRFFHTLGKTEIERITDEVVTDEMLSEAVRRQMAVYGVEFGESEYQKCLEAADRKLPVYEFLRKLEQDRSGSYEFDLRGKEDGIQYKCHITLEYHLGKISIINEYGEEKNFGFSMEEGCGMIDYAFVAPYIVDPIYFIKFAEFLGQGKQFKEELVEFVINDRKSTFYKEVFVRRIRNSLKKAMEEYKGDEYKFFSGEKQKIASIINQRKNFQKQIQFVHHQVDYNTAIRKEAEAVIGPIQESTR